MILLFFTDDMVSLKYQDGTTDITRTVHFGKPSSHEKACYTAVCGSCCFLFRISCIYLAFEHFLTLFIQNRIWLFSILKYGKSFIFFQGVTAVDLEMNIFQNILRWNRSPSKSWKCVLILIFQPLIDPLLPLLGP